MTVRVSSLYFWLTGALAGSAAGLANAAGPAPATAPALPAGSGLFQIVFALGLVIALMLALAWLFRRIGPIRSGNRIPMKMISGLQLGTRERVVVVEVDQQWLILGVTAHNISHLGSLPKQDEAITDAATADSGNLFQDWLKKNLDKRQSSNASPH